MNRYSVLGVFKKRRKFLDKNHKVISKIVSGNTPYEATIPFTEWALENYPEYIPTCSLTITELNDKI